MNAYNTASEQNGVYNNPVYRARIDALLNGEEIPPLDENLRQICQEITPTNTEPEYQGAEQLPISSVGTQNNVIRESHIPRGSALRTSAGNLENHFAADINFRGIIHAAPESFATCGNNENAFLQGVASAVKNSIILARRSGYHRVAIPFIGSAIFGGNSNRERLAKVVVYSAINQGLAEGVEVTFIS